MSDAPTQRFDLTPEPGQPAGGAPAPGPRRNRGLLIALIVVAALLVAAIVAALVLFLVPRGTPVAAVSTTSPTPKVSSPTPSPSLTSRVSPTPSATTKSGGSTSGGSGSSSGGSGGSGGSSGGSSSGGDPLALSFSADTTTVTCNSHAPAGQPPLYVTFTWKATGASQVFFGIETSDASAGPLYSNLPPSGRSDKDFPGGPVSYACYDAQHHYTMTIVDASGHKVTKTITVTNNGDKS